MRIIILGTVLIDLHTHSNESDGTDAPAQVVMDAAATGLDVIALTDHDTTAGWAQARQAALRHGVALVPGMEVSAISDGITVHILSYLHDPDDPELKAAISNIRASRGHRAQAIVDRVAMDYDISYPEIVRHTVTGATIGRPHIADALVRAGYFPDRTAVFETIFRPGSKYYVPHASPTALKAVELIRRAGGVPVFAHPGALKRGRIVDDATIEELAEAGLAGLEVFHADHDPRQVARLSALAERLGLLVTGSSDYHGLGKANRLGQFTTDAEVLSSIEDQGRIQVVRP